MYSFSTECANKALGIEDEMFRRFEERNRSMYEIGVRTTKLAALTWPTIGLIFGVGTAAIYWYGGFQVASDKLSIGGLVSFTMYLGMLIWPIMMIGFMFSNYQQAMVSGRKIFEILDTEPEVKEKPGAIDVSRVRGEVRFEDVTFGYDKDKPILKGVSFTVSPGERVAMVGATGSGKSTIVKLIPRFYDPQGGSILIDGVDIRDIKIGSLRRNIGIVHQDVFLFPTSIRENISYGKPNATQEEVKRVVGELELESMISSLPDGYGTLISPGGGNLSVGQRQLISFVRAMFKNPRILILDEATSSLNPYTESMLQEAMVKLMRGRTCLLIAHRLSTVRLADRIIVLEGERRGPTRGCSPGGVHTQSFTRYSLEQSRSSPRATQQIATSRKRVALGCVDTAFSALLPRRYLPECIDMQSVILAWGLLLT